MRTRRIGRPQGWTAAALAVLAILWPTAADAAWIKAETERFIVYGQGREARVRNLAMRLSVFDAVLRLTHPTAPKVQPRKLEVYLVDAQRDLRRVAPWNETGTVGFYAAGPSATFAVAYDGAVGIDGDEVLFHEYAHAFMLENFPAAYPGWFIEGWAEYFMTTKVTADTAEVGRPNPGRAYELTQSGWLPWDVVISRSPGDISDAARSIYYAQAWLLMHYMRSDPQRSMQLSDITVAIADGADPVKTLESVTGMSIAELGGRLRNYRRLISFTVKQPLPNPPEIKVTSMEPSADDFLLDSLRLASDSNAGDEANAALLAELRVRAAKWPGDKLAELTLARAEFAFGDVAAGEVIVKRRLGADPKDSETLFVAGQGQLRAGERNTDQYEERFKAARPYLVKAYGQDQDDYRVLLAYLRSRTVDPAYPNDNDLNALLTVRALAPTVDTAAIMLGEALLHHDRKAEAVALLSIVANDPHGGGAATIARSLISGVPVNPLAAASAALDEQSKRDAK